MLRAEKRAGFGCNSAVALAVKVIVTVAGELPVTAGVGGLKVHAICGVPLHCRFTESTKPAVALRVAVSVPVPPRPIASEVPLTEPLKLTTDSENVYVCVDPPYAEFTVN